MRELQLALIVLSGVVWREGRADADRDVLTRREPSFSVKMTARRAMRRTMTAEKRDQGKLSESL